MSLAADLRHAGRMLRLQPGFALLAIMTLALGIGATAAVFTVLDGVVLKPLQYPDAGHIVAVDTKFTDSGRSIWRTAGDDVTDLRADKASFEAVSFYYGGEMGVQLAKHAELAGTYLVDPQFFGVFSMPPLVGRTFTPDDANRAAVVSGGFAEREFGSATAALAQTVSIEGTTYEIVGVMPRFFDFPKQAEVWAAMSPIPENRNRTSYNYRVVAKLNRGTSFEIANARLEAIAARLATTFPDSNRTKTFTVTQLQDQLSAPVRPTLFTLMGAVGLVLLIACANVANLMLARATARSRELAVRSALGADHRHLVSQLLSESILLAVIAGALGLALAEWGTRALLALGAQFLPVLPEGGIQVNWHVLLFTLAVSVTTSILFGTVPAWLAARTNLQDALRQGGIHGVLGDGSSGVRGFLLVAQIALSFTLAVGAGLLFRTLLALQDSELGYRTEGILVAHTHAPANTLPQALDAGRFFDDLFTRLRQLPGVTAAAGAMGLPAGQFNPDGDFAIEGKQTFGPGRKLPHADFALASPAYFATMGIPVLRGREFNDEDQYGRQLTVVISESLAREEFANEDPLGHRIVCGLDEISAKGMTVVGVVRDVRRDSPAALPGPQLYMPLRQHPLQARDVEVVVRTSGNPDNLIPAVQSTIRRIDPQIAARFTSMTEMVNDSIRAQRFRALLASSFAVLALLLALSGMYAVMSYVTACRTSEFGLRSALGARPGNIVGLVLGGAFRLAIIGLIAGVVLSLGASRLLSTMLFGLKSTDAPTYAGVIALALPVIMFAAVLPAWRASRVDPMIALRNE